MEGWRTKSDILVSPLDLSTWHSEWRLTTQQGFRFRSYECTSECCHGNNKQIQKIINKSIVETEKKISEFNLKRLVRKNTIKNANSPSTQVEIKIKNFQNLYTTFVLCLIWFYQKFTSYKLKNSQRFTSTQFRDFIPFLCSGILECWLAHSCFLSREMKFPTMSKGFTLLSSDLDPKYPWSCLGQW